MNFKKKNLMKNRIFVSAFLFLLLWGRTFLPAQNTQTIESVLIQVGNLLAELRFDEAIALFDVIPSPERDTSDFRLLRASILSSAGRYEEALAVAEAVSRAEPGNDEAMYVISAIEGAMGRTGQQQSQLEALLRTNPNNIDALIELGKLHPRTRPRSLESAEANFRRAHSIDRTNVEALLGLGQVLRLKGEWSESESFFNEAISLYPEHPDAWAERARLYRNAEFLVNALFDLDMAARLDPRNYWISIERGTLLLEMNRRPQALEEFDRAVSINPEESQAYIYTSALKDELGDLEGAKNDYAMLARLRPDYFYAFEGLGLHMMRTGHWEEARDAFMEAYARAPDDHFYALLASICWMRVQMAGPRQFLTQVMPRLVLDSPERQMFRLFHDLSAMSNPGERDMTIRLDRMPDQILKARLLFYMAQFYEIRGTINLANRYYLMIYEMEDRMRAIPEWRLIEWTLRSRNLIPR